MLTCGACRGEGEIFEDIGGAMPVGLTCQACSGRGLLASCYRLAVTYEDGGREFERILDTANPPLTEFVDCMPGTRGWWLDPGRLLDELLEESGFKQEDMIVLAGGQPIDPARALPVLHLSPDRSPWEEPIPDDVIAKARLMLQKLHEEWPQARTADGWAWRVRPARPVFDLLLEIDTIAIDQDGIVQIEPVPYGFEVTVEYMTTAVTFDAVPTLALALEVVRAEIEDLPAGGTDSSVSD